MADNKNLESLVQSVVEGTAAESDIGVVLKTLRNQLSVNLVQSLNQSYQSIIGFNNLLNDAISRFTGQYQDHAEVLDMGTLMSYISEIQDKQLKLMDLYRKTIQGKELFSSDTLSSDEKKVLKLFNSFTSTSQKIAFMRLVEQELSKLNPND